MQRRCRLYTKAKAKWVSKTTSTKATKPGERLYLDTAGPFLLAYLKWAQVLDSSCWWLYPHHGFCKVNQNKKGMEEEFIRKLIIKLFAVGMKTKYTCTTYCTSMLWYWNWQAYERHACIMWRGCNGPGIDGAQHATTEWFCQRLHDHDYFKQQALVMMIVPDLLKKRCELPWCGEAVSCTNDLENISTSTVRAIFPIEMMKGNYAETLPSLVYVAAFRQNWLRPDQEEIKSSLEGKAGETLDGWIREEEPFFGYLKNVEPRDQCHQWVTRYFYYHHIL